MRCLALITLTTALSGCQSIYYGFWEALGQEKRDLLTDEVEGAKDDQKDVQEQFKDTLTRLRSEYGDEGSDLEQAYDQLSSDYDDAKARADALRQRADKIKTIADDLFAEWEDEASTITNASYRQDSRAKLRTAKERYAVMERRLDAVVKSLDPVLVQLNDHVLHMKHNLNARSLATFKKEFDAIEGEVNKLTREIERSISASDEFMAQI